MKKVVPVDGSLISATGRAKRSFVPEQGGVAKEETSFLFTTRGERPLELDYAQNLWDGCFRGGYGESCSQWIHHGCLGA
jgi:hypothetical protein